MKKNKALASIIVLILAVWSAPVLPGQPQNAVVPDGFLGVPWGANTDQVVKAMKGRGCRPLQGAESGRLVFKGAFAGEPCQLSFRLLANSFYSATANFIARSSRPAAPRQAFQRIVQDLTAKYGPPTTRGSGTLKTNDGKEHPQEGAVWELLDGRTSDKYSITVDLGVTWFMDDTGDQYVVNVSYWAASLGERLKEKEY